MMNMSRVISHIKMKFGLQAVTLPFKDEITGDTTPTEQVIKDVLSTMTIPIYSQFSPWIREGNCEVSSLKCVSHREHIYMLPAFLTLTPVMYVVDVSLPMVNTRGTYGDIAPSFGINRSVQGVITSQAYMMLAGQMRAEPTFEYLGNNKIKLYGYPKCMLTFSLACEHDPSGETIPDSCYDSFMELAELDMKIFLYNNLKYFKDLPTAFGNINLGIDAYEGAESEQKALLDKWRDSYHLDMGWEKWM